MFGKILHKHTYYACQPPDRRRPDTHPVSIVVPEAPLLEFLGEFVNTRLLGPDRADYLATAMADLDQDIGADHARRLAGLDRQIADLTAKQQRLLRQAEDGEPGDPFTTGLRRRYNDLDTQRRDLEHQRATLAADPPRPSLATAQQLLAYLPTATLDSSRCRRRFSAASAKPSGSRSATTGRPGGPATPPKSKPERSTTCVSS